MENDPIDLVFCGKQAIDGDALIILPKLIEVFKQSLSEIKNLEVKDSNSTMKGGITVE